MLKCIPGTNSLACKRRAPWWNGECRKACKRQNRSWRLLRDSPTVVDLMNFKHIKSQERRTCRQARRESWSKFLSGVNSYTDEAIVLNMVNKVRMRETYTLPLVNTQGDTLEDQANFLGAQFENVSSSSHYSETFQWHKIIIEKQKLQRKCAKARGIQ